MLAAVAAMPRREPHDPETSFERDCPACGRPVVFTQVSDDEGVGYVIEEHACR